VSVRPSVCQNETTRILWGWGGRDFCEILYWAESISLEKIQVSLKWTKITGTFHEDPFMTTIFSGVTIVAVDNKR